MSAVIQPPQLWAWSPSAAVWQSVFDTSDRCIPSENHDLSKAMLSTDRSSSTFRPRQRLTDKSFTGLSRSKHSSDLSIRGLIPAIELPADQTQTFQLLRANKILIQKAATRRIWCCLILLRWLRRRLWRCMQTCLALLLCFTHSVLSVS